jgi:hypothetical protein
MKERPILFFAPMVRALLAGTKTQTRRAVRKQFAPDAVVAEVGATTPEGWQVSGHSGLWWDDAGACLDDAVRCPYGIPGDLLWVREAWKAHTTFDHLPPRDIPQSHVWYLADDGYKADSRYRHGMFMPRWASRILLEVTAVRVERLQDISEADARAEGVAYDPGEGGTFHVPGIAGCASDSAADAFRKLRQQINGPDSWAANPWVWVVEFKRVTT